MTGPRTGPSLLLVEDDPASVRLMTAVLEAHGFPGTRVVPDAASALTAGGDAEIILLDYQLPDGTGLDILAQLKAKPSRPSIIIVTGSGSEELAAQALRLGADDYLAKNPSLPQLLPQVVERTRRARALAAALAVAERDLLRAERLAAVGELTVTLHHEINNPLMAATASADFLLHGRDPLTDAQRAELTEIQQALERIRLIVQRVGTLTTAPSRDYATGMRMLDLRDDASAPAVQRGLAGIWTRNEDVARVAGMLLRREGWRVERCTDIAALQRVAESPSAGLLLLEPGADSDAFDGFRPAPDRSYTIAVLGEDARRTAVLQPDLVVPMPFDPDQFVAEMRSRFG